MRRLAPLCLLVLSFGAVACSGDRGAPDDLMATASRRTVEEGTSRVAMQLTNEGGRRPGTIRGDGVVDLRAQRGQLTLDLSSLGLPPGSPAEMRLFGEVYYFDFPPEVPEFAGRRWLKVDPRELSERSSANLGGLHLLAYLDPAASVQLLQAVSEGLEVVGQEQVRGTPTTHYRARLDLERVASQVPAQARDDVARAKDVAGVRHVPVEAWVDEGGRLRKVRQIVDLSQAKVKDPTDTPYSGTLTITFELFDFGSEVHVDEPPPDQVTDLSSLLPSPAPPPPAA